MRDVRFKIDAATGCWNCTSHQPGSAGYPLAKMNGFQTTLHRHLYMQQTGRQLPSDIFVIHSCDNKMCINPAHLREGTAADNNRDAADKNRKVYGERHHMSKLTTPAARAIFHSNERITTLAHRHGVTPSTIHAVKHGKTWVRATGIGRR